MKFLAIYYQ